MRAPRFTSLFIVPVLALVPVLGHAAAPVAQGANCNTGKEPASALLPLRPLTGRATSWDGRRVAAPVTPTPGRPVNPRFPWRRADPMGIVLNGAHPGTKVSVLRQRQSKDVEVPSCVGDCSVLRDLAASAADYAEMFSFTTENTSANAQHAEVVTEPSKVAWPGSRMLIKATTRDGQKHPPLPLVAEGAPTMRTQVYDVGSNGIQHVEVSGRHLPAARAWIKAKNLYVSEPTRNVALIQQGESALQVVEGLERDAGKLDEQIATEQAKPTGADRQRIRDLSTQVSTLRAKIQTDRPAAEAMITRGKKVMVQVASVGATPAATPVTTVNTRLAGEQGPGVVHTATGSTEAVHGFVTHEVEAIHGDEVRMSAAFTGGANARSSSAMVEFRVPAASAKPAFTLGGVKYYRVDPTAQRRDHDPDPTPNE